MKKLIVITILLFALLLSIKNPYTEKEQAIEKTIEINDEFITSYETKIKEDKFKDKTTKKIYTNGYKGFLNWITNREYKQLDEDFNMTEGLK